MRKQGSFVYRLSFPRYVGSASILSDLDTMLKFNETFEQLLTNQVGVSYGKVR